MKEDNLGFDGEDDWQMTAFYFQGSARVIDKDAFAAMQPVRLHQKQGEPTTGEIARILEQILRQAEGQDLPGCFFLPSLSTLQDMLKVSAMALSAAFSELDRTAGYDHFMPGLYGPITVWPPPWRSRL